MKIYIAHASNFDFKNDLYEPIRRSSLSKEYSFCLPHDSSNKLFNTKELLEKCNLVIAEVSYPSTGMGIELGWANVFKVPIVCFYKKGTKPSNSLKIVTNLILEYRDSDDLISKIKEAIKTFQ